ncbi:MAG: hypothetical protein JRJ50_15760 [Deltaproteobacteria bacterium]|nr:hypothetical protein [Deltaproteobacteria bacterium]
MEHKILERDAPEYPQKLITRLNQDAPERIYYHGPLELLDIFTMGYISADSITGLGLMTTNHSGWVFGGPIKTSLFSAPRVWQKRALSLI